MTARLLGRSEARLAAEHLARAEAWLDQAAPDLQAEIARIRVVLLQRADMTLEPGSVPVWEEIGVETVTAVEGDR